MSGEKFLPCHFASLLIPPISATESPALEDWSAVASEVRAGIAPANEKRGDRRGSSDSTDVVSSGVMAIFW